MAYEGPRSHRPLIIGRRGAVASNHPLATQAGLLALQAGGNAVDAAVAVGRHALRRRAVHVRPRRRRLLPRLPHGGPARRSSSTGPAPRRARPRRSATRPASRRPGPLAVSVPGSVGAWGAMHARFGRRPWASPPRGRDPLRPRGVRRHPRLPALRRRAGRRPPAHDARSARVFLRDGAPARAVGAPIVQPDLARTPRAPRRGRSRGLLPRRARAAPRRRVPGRRAPGDRRRPRRVPARRAGADRASLSRLHGPRGAAELHGLGAAPGARHRRALRPRRDGPALRRPASTPWSRRRSSPSRTASGGAATRAFVEAPLERAPLGRVPRAPRGRDRSEARGAGRAAAATAPRRHHLLLRGGRRGQRRLRHPEHQQRVRLRRDRRATPASC